MSRHRWGQRVVFVHKTERVCERCGIIKVSRSEHEGGRDRYWTEFYAAGGFDRIQGEATPACTPAEAIAS